MFIYCTKVHLKDTDATGVIYFSEQFRMGLEAFEEYLISENISIRSMIENPHFLIPIVHAEADYLVPLYIGEEIEIQLTIKEIKNSSFCTFFQIFKLKTKERVGSISLVHVAISTVSKKSISIPQKLLIVLQKLQLSS